MDAYLVIVLCLPSMFLYVQAEDQPMAPVSTNVDDMLDSLEEALALPEEPVDKVAEGPDIELAPADGPEMAYEALLPYTEPRRGFEYQINRGIRQCNRQIRLPNCSWRRGYFVTASFETFEQEISDDVCCCACHQVNECDAIHYERREGKCVFHQSPRLRRRRRPGTRRWSKY